MNRMQSASISLPIPLFEDDVIIPLSDRKTVATLLADDCRWPFGRQVEVGGEVVSSTCYGLTESWCWRRC